MRMVFAVCWLAIVPACFETSLHKPCGAGDRCPIGLTCNAQICVLPFDSGVVDAELPIDADPVAPLPELCPRDPSVMLCFEFEDTTRDGSVNGLDARGTNVGFDAGLVGRGLRLDETSDLVVPDSPVLDVTAITIQAWVFPSTLPAPNRRFGVVDADMQYGVFISDGGIVTCTLGDVPQMSLFRLTAARWTHITCTYDGSTLRLFHDGSLVFLASNGNPISHIGTSGLQIGANGGAGSTDRLTGMIDQLRLMNVARSPEQVCRDAGRSDC